MGFTSTLKTSAVHHETEMAKRGRTAEEKRQRFEKNKQNETDTETKCQQPLGNVRQKAADLEEGYSAIDIVLRGLVNNLFVNGMFSLCHLVGYTQFMVYVIVRVIITGALAGRLFANDIQSIECNFTIGLNGTILWPLNESENETGDVNWDEVKSTCLRVAYNGNISPLIAWVLSLFTAVIPWLMVMPWTPFEIGQDYITCPMHGCTWPCLTLYLSSAIRAMMRFCLELVAFVTIVVAYRMYVPMFVRCYDEAISCILMESVEKTCFLWLFSAINLQVSVCYIKLHFGFVTQITSGLSAWELKHMYSHRELYEKESMDTYTFREIQCNSVEPPIYQASTDPSGQRQPAWKWQNALEKRKRFEGVSTSGASDVMRRESVIVEENEKPDITSVTSSQEPF